MILSVIGRFAPLSANTAGTHSSLEPDKVTRAVDVLVGQGYVVRRQDPTDRRKVVLSLSAKGKRVHDELNQLRDAIEHEFLRVLTSTEVATLYQIVDKLEAQAVQLFSDKKVWGLVLEGLAVKAGGKPPRRAAKPSVKKIGLGAAQRHLLLNGLSVRAHSRVQPFGGSARKDIL